MEEVKFTYKYMKIDFSSSCQAQVIDYIAPEIREGNIYLDESVLNKLRELKWLDKEILDKLEFEIYPSSNGHRLYEWKIYIPIPKSKNIGTIAQLHSTIKGQITPQGRNYICTYSYS